MDKDIAAFVEKWRWTGQSSLHVAKLEVQMTADLAALLAVERERFKDIFIWRDGEPYYYTRNGMPMEIPERIIKKIKAAAIRADRPTP